MAGRDDHISLHTYTNFSKVEMKCKVNKVDNLDIQTDGIAINVWKYHTGSVKMGN